jgi:hypothetical protein
MFDRHTNSDKGEADKIEQAKNILRQCPHISDHDLRFILSLPLEEKSLKVTDLPTVIATEQQQREMERQMSSRNKNRHHSE